MYPWEKYPSWIWKFNPVYIWTFQPCWDDYEKDAKEKVRKATTLVGDLFEEFYKGTDTEVFDLAEVVDLKDPSQVYVYGEDNAIFTIKYDDRYNRGGIVYQNLRSWFKVYTMKRENIPKVKSLLDDWKLLFLADVKFDEFLKEINGDEKKVIDLLKKYPQHIPEDAEKKISIEFLKAYKIYKYVELSGDEE